MTMISRRQLITTGLKAGAGLLVLHHLEGSNQTVFAATRFQRTATNFQPAYQRLDEFIARHMAEVGVPGMTLALADRNGLLRSSQYGFADVKAGIKVAPETLFEIGSISKSFVAMAILQLAEEGKLDLNKPVTSLSSLAEGRVEVHAVSPLIICLVTPLDCPACRCCCELRQRLCAPVLSRERAGFIRTLATTFSGSCWKLSTSGRSRKRCVSAYLNPLGMSASVPVISNDVRERMAVGYGPLQPDRPFPVRGKLGEAPWLEVPEAAGSIAATAGDMGNYLQMLLNGGAFGKGRVLSEKSFDLFTKPVIKSPFRGEDASYAYGLWVSDTNGHKLLRHTGGMVAFSSAMYADETDGLGAFASVNAARLPGGYRPIPVIRYALALLSAAAKGQELPAAPATSCLHRQLSRMLQTTPAHFRPPAGEKLVLSSEGDQLILEHAGSRIVLEQAGPDLFLVKHPDFELFTLGFGREKDAVVEAFHGLVGGRTNVIRGRRSLTIRKTGTVTPATSIRIVPGMAARAW